MNNKKLGFTLIELMATLAIFSVVMVLVSGILLQGYKILNRTSNYSDIENTFRNAILNIEKTVSSYEDKNIIIYNNKNRISVINEEYPEDKQEALMCIIPKGESVVRSTEEKVIYMQVESKSGDKQLIEVIFEDADKDKFLDKENGVGPKVKITPKSTKVLISKLDSSGQVSFENNNNIINIAIAGITSGKDVSEKVYSNSISLSEERDITIEVGEGSGGEGGVNPDPNPDPPNILPDEDKLDELVEQIFKYNINISGNLDFQSNSDKVTLNGNGTLGYGGDIVNGGFDEISSNKVKKEYINMFNINIGEKYNAYIKNGTNNITGTYIEKYINKKNSEEKYRVILINGNLIIGDKNKDVMNIRDTIIICTGNVEFEKNEMTFNMDNSILYGNELNCHNKSKININNTNGVDGILKDVKEGIKDILKDYIESITLDFTIETVWGEHSQFLITIKNNMSIDIKGWELRFNSNLDLLESWNTEIKTIESKRYFLKNQSYNGYIQSGKSIEIRGKCTSGENTLSNIVITFDK